MVFVKGVGTGNGNGNKMNLRVANLEGLLKTMSGEGMTSKANALKQVIRRNKTDFADDVPSSLDLIRKIFQPSVTQEIHLIIDRHLRTTFVPAFENLNRAGLVVTDEDKNEIACNFLENAKSAFLPTPGSRRQSNGSELAHMKRHYDSDEGSDISAVSHGSREHKRRRGRPRKEDEILLTDPHPVTQQDLDNWSGNRLNGQQKFVYTSKVASKMGIQQSKLFEKYPRMFRYICDDEDKTHLYDTRHLSKLSGKIIMMLYEDACTLVGRCPEIDSKAFYCPESVLRRIQNKAKRTHEQLLLRSQQPQNGFGFRF